MTKSRFFKTKKSDGGGAMLFVNSRQVGTIWWDKTERAYCVFLLKDNSLNRFKRFPDADLFAWANFT